MKGWWKEPFLKCLTEEHRETVCADAVGISRRAVAYEKANNPDFRAQVESAHAARSRTDVDQSLRRLRRHQHSEMSEL